MSERIRVLLVDDNRDLCEMLSRFFSLEKDMECVGTLECADNVVSVAASTNPHIIVMDLTMPGRDPNKAIAELAAAHPSVRTIAYSGWDEAEIVDAAFAAGAWEIISKSAETSELIAAIRRIAGLGERPRDP